VGRIKDLARDIKGGGFMETLLHDLRYGARRCTVGARLPIAR
jgi:hypothetical protein